MSNHSCRLSLAVILFTVLMTSALHASPGNTVLKGVPFKYSPPAGLSEEFGEIDIPVTVALDGEIVYSGTSEGLKGSPPMLKIAR